ncbi:MAG: cupin domain-containing protein [Deltaproteobacteria bacterium]
MPVIKDPSSLPARRTTIYPPPFDKGFERRAKRALTDLLGLTQFGINLTTLEPGAQSSHRHWHAKEDEAIVVLEGVLTLITDEGERELMAGMIAGFPAGVPNGHHLVNRSRQPATYVEIGTRASEDDVVYSDVDLKAKKRAGVFSFARKTGEPLP